MFFLLLTADRTFAACSCVSQGSRVGGTGGKPMVSVSFLYSVSHTFLKGSSPVPNTLGKVGRLKSFNLNFLSQCTPTLFASIMVPVVEKKLTFNFGAEQLGRGIGDISILFTSPLDEKKAAADDPGPARRIRLGAGLKFPTGAFRQKIEGVVQSYTVQPGTGSLDAMLYANMHVDRDWGFHSFSVIAGVMGTNPDQYRNGNDLSLEYKGHFLLLPPWNAAASLRFRTAGKDTQAGMILDSTGGRWLTLSPEITRKDPENADVTLTLHLPIYSKVNGTQLTASWSVELFVSRNQEKSDENNAARYQ